MERYLMDRCLRYEKDVCNESVKRARCMSGPMEPGDPVPMFPIGEEQKKLDVICESCPHGFFEVEEPENPICPVCRKGLWDLDGANIIEGPIENEPGALVTYQFKCPKCEKNIFSRTNLWA